LSREGIVEAALRVMDAEGLERTTMRRLAQELDTGAASLYVYVRNTAELYAAMLDEMLGSVDLSPREQEGDWRERLTRVLTSYTEVLMEYPSLARSALVARPSGPHYLNLLDALLALLGDGDVPPEQAAWGVDLLLEYATTTAAEQGTRRQAIDAQDEEDALAQAIQTASPETHPHIAALGADLLSGPGRDRFAWGFEVLINGLLRTPRPTPRAAEGPKPKAAT
jgi:AcrR family transcriptional regulator